MADEDYISFKCAECGSKEFIYPNQPPKDDDIIKCNGCKREIGRYDVIRRATIDAAKGELNKTARKMFGKPFKWE